MQKVYVITGGSSGMGYQLARELSQEHKVIILSRNAESIDIVDGSNVFGINTDIRSIEQINQAYQQVRSSLKINTIDGLINCAGVAYEKKITDVTEKDYDDIFSTNVCGLIFTTKIFLDIIKNDTGIICNISSIAGIKGFSDWSIYCSSKFAVEGFTQSIRHEVRERGIRVTSIRPGSVDTNIYKHVSTEEKKDFIKPQTIAEVIVDILKLPKEAVVEDIFINNSVGDL